MISVPNLQPPSNGSSLAFRFLLLLLLVSSTLACGGLRKAPQQADNALPPADLEEIEGKTKNDNRTDSDLVLEEPVEDTGKESEESPEPVDKENAEASPATTFLDPNRSLEFAVMLPFLGDRLDPASLSIDERTLPALSFFRGMEMALDSIRRNPSFPDINFRIYDTQANPATVYSLLSDDTLLKKADVIVGPMRPVNIEMVATIANARGQVVLSPFSANSSFVEANPRFFQVTPSLETHCQTITNHIRSAWAPQQVALICRDKAAELERLDYFRQANARLSAPEDTASAFREYIIPDTSDVYIGIDFRPLLDDSVRVFVVPSWSNRAFVYAVLRLLSSQVLEEDGPVTVYGMPQWMEFDISSYEYFEKLNVHITTPVFANPFQPETTRLYHDYYNRYATFPVTESWLGYDLTLYLAQAAADAGLNIPWRMPVFSSRGLTTGFEFGGVSLPDNPAAPPEYYVNRQLHILEFENYRFVPADMQ